MGKSKGTAAQRINVGSCTAQQFLAYVDELRNASTVQPPNPFLDQRVPPLVIYGAGELGALTIDALRWAGVEPAFVSDTRWDRDEQPSDWHGVPTVTPEFLEFSKAEMCLVLAISRFPHSEVLAANPERFVGWQAVMTSYDALSALHPRQPIRNGWPTAEWAPSAWEQLTLIGEQLHDDESRANLLSAVAWRHIRQEWLFADHGVGVKGNGTDYAIPEVTRFLERAESVIDVGAHKGRFLQTLLEHRARSLASYTGFEPDRESFDRLAQSLSPSLPRSRVHLRQEAISDQAGQAPFAAGLGYASQIVAPGQRSSYVVDTVSIDELGVEFDVLKVHSESSDLAVISGSLASVDSNGAAVLCTMYHNSEAFLGVPKLLLALPHRRLLIRQGGHLGCGVVAFSLPM